MTTKQRAYLKSLAMTIEPIYQIGKSALTPEITQGVSDALEAREIIKINVLKNCMDEPKQLAQVLSERTHSEIVQVIGKKIVLYRESKDKKKIVLPEEKKSKNKE
jgi:RNA-binding protein